MVFGPAERLEKTKARSRAYLDALERYAVASVVTGREQEAFDAAVDVVASRPTAVPFSVLAPVLCSAALRLETAERLAGGADRLLADLWAEDES